MTRLRTVALVLRLIVIAPVVAWLAWREGGKHG